MSMAGARKRGRVSIITITPNQTFRKSAVYLLNHFNIKHNQNGSIHKVLRIMRHTGIFCLNYDFSVHFIVQKM